jgi:hypothetical protein
MADRGPRFGPQAGSRCKGSRPGRPDRYGLAPSRAVTRARRKGLRLGPGRHMTRIVDLPPPGCRQRSRARAVAAPNFGDSDHGRRAVMGWGLARDSDRGESRSTDGKARQCLHPPRRLPVALGLPTLAGRGGCLDHPTAAIGFYLQGVQVRPARLKFGRRRRRHRRSRANGIVMPGPSLPASTVLGASESCRGH